LKNKSRDIGEKNFLKLLHIIHVLHKLLKFMMTPIYQVAIC